MPERSEERTEFLRDIITTAVEGGTNDWAQISQYQWLNDDGTVMTVVGRRVGDDARAVLHPLKDDESGYVDEGRVVDIEVIARGVSLIIDKALVNSQMLTGIKQANRENDAGYIDAYDASAIVQAGLFGEVIYG